MTDTVAAVMRHVNNFFLREAVEGVFTISGDGVLSPAVDAPYIAVTGSMWHDGLYDSASDMKTGHEETFEGTVWALCPPAQFLALCKEIEAYEAKNPTGAPVSESFGGYSYSRGTSGQSGCAITWREAFSDALRPYRRMFSEVVV